MLFRDQRREDGRDVACIVAAWAMVLVMHGLLQLAGIPVGFDVWPIGEDWAWVLTLKGGSAGEIAQRMWTMFDRNPLLVWWYIAAKPVILGFDSGMLLLRHGMRLALAVATYGVLLGASGHAGRPIALASGVLIAVFSANGYPDNLQWPLLGTLAISLSIIWTYTRFRASDRRAYGWYVASLLLWLVVLTSYTLQSGAILAIALIGLRPQPGESAWSLGRIRTTIADVVPYGLIFALYGMIWKTVSNPSLAGHYELQPSLQALASSVLLGVWHVDFKTFWYWLGRPLPVAWQGILLVLSSLALYALLRWRRADLADSLGRPGSIAFSLLIATCLVLPTVVVEATASHTWAPGTRWRMVQPFWLPVLFSGTLTAVLVALRRFGHVDDVWRATIASFGGILILVGVGFSNTQVLITRSERIMRAGLERLVEEDVAQGTRTPLTYLVRFKPGAHWMSSDALSPTYASNWFPGLDVSFRIVQSEPAPNAEWGRWWRIGFDPDSDGVTNARVGGAIAPYAQVRVATFDGEAVEPVENAPEDLFRGLQVDWRRAGPLPSPERKPRACPATWSAEQEPVLPGWSVGEKDAGGPFRWTVAREARLLLPRCGEVIEIEFEAFALSEGNAAGLRAFIDGREIPLERRNAPGGLSYRGRVEPPTSERRYVSLELRVPTLDVVAGASRRFGVAVRQVRLSAVPKA